jgi:hypothetical protein
MYSLPSAALSSVAMLCYILQCFIIYILVTKQLILRYNVNVINEFGRIFSAYLLLRVFGCVTNNNGIWTG